ARPRARGAVRREGAGRRPAEAASQRRDRDHRGRRGEGGSRIMTRFDTPEGRLAEALVESPMYSHQVHALAVAAWDEAKGYRGRVAKLSRRLKLWMAARDPFEGDHAPLEKMFYRLAIDR